jgi:putative oxidoreductase
MIMERLWNMLTPATYGNRADIGLLILRLGLGLLMMGHGWSKLIGFNENAADFYNLLGLGGEISLGLTVFAEFFCSILLILGLGTQLALVPLTIMAMVIVLDVKAGKTLDDKELILLYLMGYVALLLTGPGRFSLDYFIWRKKV